MGRRGEKDREGRRKGGEGTSLHRKAGEETVKDGKEGEVGERQKIQRAGRPGEGRRGERRTEEREGRAKDWEEWGGESRECRSAHVLPAAVLNLPRWRGWTTCRLSLARPRPLPTLPRLPPTTSPPPRGPPPAPSSWSASSLLPTLSEESPRCARFPFASLRESMWRSSDAQEQALCLHTSCPHREGVDERGRGGVRKAGNGGSEGAD